MNINNPFFISDHHFTHKNILNFCNITRNFGKLQNIKEHDEWLIEQHNSVVKPQDTTIFVGDVTFSCEGLKYLKQMNGKKILIKGNHDRLTNREYASVFDEIYNPYTKFKKFLISHYPIHHQEIKFHKANIHGHVHQNTINDEHYINVCIDALNGIPISFEEILSKYS